MLQEEQTVSFQPIGYEGRVPWYVNLFLVYLLYVLLSTVADAIRITWTLRKHRRSQEREAIREWSSHTWECCHSRVRSIRNFSHLTFLLATLVLSWNVTDILAGAATEKTQSLSYLAGRLAQALVPFGIGIIFCSGQFCCAMFLESFLRRRRLPLEQKTSKRQPPVE